MRKLSSKLAGQQSGFTLIELVIVIVIIGILAAVAIPNFTNLTGDANESVADGIAGAMASENGTNRALAAGGKAIRYTSCAAVYGGIEKSGIDLSKVTIGETPCSVTYNAKLSTKNFVLGS